MKTYAVAVTMGDILHRNGYNKNLVMRPVVWRDGPGESQLGVPKAIALSRGFSLAIGVSPADALTRVTTCPFCKSEVEERLCLLPQFGAQCDKCGALMTRRGRAYQWKDKESQRHVGQVNYLKIYDGSLKSGTYIYNVNKKKKQRISRVAFEKSRQDYLKTIQKATSASDRILLSLQEEAGDV